MNIQAIDSAKETQLQVGEGVQQVQPREADVQIKGKDPVQAVAEQTGQAGQNRQSDKQADGKTGKKPDAEETARIVRQANEYYQAKDVNLQFKTLDDGKELQVQMVDSKSGKVIRKIPDDELVKLQENIKRMAKGVMDLSV